MVNLFLNQINGIARIQFTILVTILFLFSVDYYFNFKNQLLYKSSLSFLKLPCRLVQCRETSQRCRRISKAQYRKMYQLPVRLIRQSDKGQMISHYILALALSSFQPSIVQRSLLPKVKIQIIRHGRYSSSSLKRMLK